MKVLVAQSCLYSPTLWTVALQAPLSTGFTGKNTGVGSHSLLQGIFLIQGWNLGFLHCRQILYYLRHRVGDHIKMPVLLCWLGQSLRYFTSSWLSSDVTAPCPWTTQFQYLGAGYLWQVSLHQYFYSQSISSPSKFSEYLLKRLK